jgi:hypothetical protein
MAGGANSSSLVDAQRNFANFGASEKRFLENVRAPAPHEIRDGGWRLVDLATDRPETPLQGVDYGGTYPEDSATLYYWRASYWRRAAT